jgi:mono/diheme cytochrome c family protein
MRALLGGVAAGVVLAAAWPVFSQPADPVSHGHEVYQYWCATCHGAGPGHPGTDALQAKYHGSKPALLEDRTDLTPDEVRYFVRHGVTIMPFFRKTEISDADLDAIGAYLSRKR